MLQEAVQENMTGEVRKDKSGWPVDSGNKKYLIWIAWNMELQDVIFLKVIFKQVDMHSSLPK